MEIGLHEFLTKYFNPGLNPLIASFDSNSSDCGIWRQGVRVYDRSVPSRSSLGVFVERKREEIRNSYSVLGKTQITDLVDNLVRDIHRFVERDTNFRLGNESRSNIWSCLDRFCKDISGLFGDSKFRINLKLGLFSGFFFRNDVRLFKDIDGKAFEEFELGRSNPNIEVDLSPGMYLVQVETIFLFFFKKKKFAILPVFKDRKVSPRKVRL